jgi:hypothetical protein
MKKLVLCAICLVLALPLLASPADVGHMRLAEPTLLPDLNVPFSDMMRDMAGPENRLGSPRIRPNVVLEGSEAGFVLPIVGSTPASGGLFFHSETVIVNRRTVPQTIAIYYFPFGGGAANCTRPARQMQMAAQTWYFWGDFVADFLQTSGLGAVIVLGVTPTGNLDSSAMLDGNSRIWTPQPGTSGTASQNFPSISLNMPPGAQSSFGLRADEFYRSNYGLFNYDITPRTFDITANGLRGQTSFSVSVDACSAILTGVPGGPYGSYELVVAARDGRALYFSFGSSADNVTGDTWSVIGRSF